jgi:hypothetical protein
MAEKYGALLERGAGKAPGPVAKLVTVLCGGGAIAGVGIVVGCWALVMDGTGCVTDGTIGAGEMTIAVAGRPRQRIWINCWGGLKERRGLAGRGWTVETGRRGLAN